VLNGTICFDWKILGLLPLRGMHLQHDEVRSETRVKPRGAFSIKASPPSFLQGYRPILRKGDHQKRWDPEEPLTGYLQRRIEEA
jgi:hypothetical protein